MTAIAGFVQDGVVWMGGDSAAVDISTYGLTIRTDRKVFQCGPFLIGYTSSFRMGQLLQYSLRVPERDPAQDVTEFIATVFVNAVRDCLKAGGYAKKENEQESAGVFLVGYQKRLFSVDGDYSIGESVDSYDACGSGEDLARGAMFALAHSGKPAVDILTTALEATEHHSVGVRGPFSMLALR